MTEAYDPIEVQGRWQARWAADRLHEVDVERADDDRFFYNLVEFPYPSAEGLHVGHAFTYSGADTYGRWLRMRGRTVFQPIGFDAFGIHTENYALRVGEDPATLTGRTIVRYRGQLERLGAAWDWDHSVTTSDPSYYRWTQWLFLRLHEAGLAVREQAPVVWCPSCLTVLANEQLEGDRCERCGTRVTRRVMRQWFLRITAYADRLVDGLEGLDWPETAKNQQREWIGRSAGVEVDFELDGGRLSTFTTRPDTLFGVTFLAVPPDHPGLDGLVAGTGQEAAVAAFAEEAERRAVAGRDRDRRGVPTGRSARHPLTGAPVPIWVTDYVVAGYGTGAVMGVPAHDERDLAFATAVGLPVVAAELAEDVTDRLEALGRGRRVTRYRLHDWLISRQRSWGPPIPIVYCERCGTVPVPDADLPVLLPRVPDFRPTGSGRSPLASVADVVATSCPSCGGPATRETDVSDTFLDSAWYFLRYPSAGRDDVAWDPELTGRRLPVDSYSGGPEHVARHHLYARFVTMALHDLGLVPFAEPFPRLRLHGFLLKDGAKMSKSRGNVVVPDDYVNRVGADNLRMYLLFCAPWEDGGDWSDAGLAGIERFSARAWRLLTSSGQPGPGGVDLRPLHQAVAAVGRSIERLKFNTAISALMELLRWARRERPAMDAAEWERVARTFTLLLAPLAPHLAEELWSRLGGPYPVVAQPWPEPDPDAIAERQVTLVVQVAGKLRDTLPAPPGLDRDRAVALALTSERVRRHLGHGQPRDAVYVPDRLVNLLP
ncbi:MAG TPA: leucine--tRNA ligase [Actinomycetota bacterium]|nr:leucine--tRNA ligase [Actinomycetota bacterium]